jgi:DNA polymerase-3 subunit beta
MKFTVKKDLIVKEISLLQGIVEKRNTMPILSSILFECSGQLLNMYATDLEVSIRVSLPVNGISDGKIALPGKKVFDIIKSFKDGVDIEISIEEEGKILIKGDSTQFVLFGASPEDFPEIPIPESEEFFEIPQNILNVLIERVDYILAQETRFSFGGALFRISPSLIEMVATDGNRLSYSKEATNISTKEDFEVILPKKLLSELSKIEGDFFRFTHDVNNLYFECGGTLLISRKLDAKFPPWRGAIPTENKNIAIVNRDGLRDSLKRVSLLASEKGRAIKFIFKDKTLQMRAFNPEIGEAFDQIEIDYKGEPIEIIFNSSYILEFLNSVECERIRFEMMDFEKPVLIKPEDIELNYLYVVAPIKI